MNILNKQKGLAAIELTLVLPFLLLIIFATVEFSRMLYQYNALNKFVRDASRYLINHAANGSTKTIDLRLAYAKTINLLKQGDNASSTELLPGLSSSSSVTTSSQNLVVVTSSTTVVTLSANGNLVSVKVVYNWQPIFFSVLPSFASGTSIDMSFPLEVNYTMRALGA